MLQLMPSVPVASDNCWNSCCNNSSVVYTVIRSTADHTNVSQYVCFQFSFDRNPRWLFDDTAHFAITSWNTASVAIIVLQTGLQSPITMATLLCDTLIAFKWDHSFNTFCFPRWADGFIPDFVSESVRQRCNCRIQRRWLVNCSKQLGHCHGRFHVTTWSA